MRIAEVASNGTICYDQIRLAMISTAHIESFRYRITRRYRCLFVEVEDAFVLFLNRPLQSLEKSRPISFRRIKVATANGQLRTVGVVL